MKLLRLTPEQKRERRKRVARNFKKALPFLGSALGIGGLITIAQMVKNKKQNNPEKIDSQPV